MAKDESDIEILKLAVAREVDAYKVFTRLAERVEDQQLKEFFKALAGEELEHKSRLEFELMKLGVVVPSFQEITAEELSEYDTGRSLVDLSYKEILLFAIDKERKSLRLYVELAAMAKYKSSREMLISLAENEAMHEARFEAQYNSLMQD